MTRATGNSLFTFEMADHAVVSPLDREKFKNKFRNV